MIFILQTFQNMNWPEADQTHAPDKCGQRPALPRKGESLLPAATSRRRLATANNNSNNNINKSARARQPSTRTPPSCASIIVARNQWTSPPNRPANQHAPSGTVATLVRNTVEIIECMARDSVALGRPVAFASMSLEAPSPSIKLTPATFLEGKLSHCIVWVLVRF